LRRWQDSKSYPNYRNAFERLLRDQAQYREYTRLESEKDLVELAEAGNVFDIHVDDRWAGLTAVDEAGEEGLEGYLMNEILLDEHARGKRLASAVQRHLIEQLPDRRRLLIGTIDSRNCAAIRAAARLGRSDVGGYFWSSTASEEQMRFGHQSIVELLRNGPLTVGEIADRLGLRQPQTSKHLKVPSDNGILEVKVDANRRIYSLRPEPFQALDAWLRSFRRVTEERFDNLDDYLRELQDKENQ
jgi:DNA-binding transcriptional ArsR family regulator/GNAT superfamily N-acetyltransferase